MTKQDIFTKVKNHLLTQRARAFDSRFGCRYRTADQQQSCAVGCLIPDSLYLSSMEGKGINDLIEAHPDLAEHGLSTDNCNLLYELQGVHDCLPIKEWEDALREVALRHSLDFGQ